ncbi:uncharacterized protein TRIADDRAFT_63204 [Trichoplax adhaerens]|uniref:Alanine--glyoxylate aminotransferase 2, mitochondrial n=1 Tax=Trichoplax adhaerens TaxID=10228 RepID=B3RJD8_TRIAD|nr:hypothetical protein TRIADDRAFT_63204 [Trichoplax adhaerens]EDV29075.1 hypothetical protein TRIADDRAFT_63204 [Trichoplax adhaerens]|eukprot:XP_002108277.1 hypothetical protein TRIADDRAFT_63204 [Trichoplax adhaerens]
MPPCDFKPEKYKGMSASKIMQIRKEKLTPSLVTYYKDPLVVHQGHMQWLFDINGRRFLDLFGGIVTVSVGHCHPVVTAAAEKQMKKLWHTTSIYVYPSIHEYAEKLMSKFSGNLKVCFFANSGSEANDLAMLLARVHTGNFDLISLRNAYHGVSPYTMGITAHSTWLQPVPTRLGCVQTMNPDVYRGPWGGSRCRDSVVQTTRDCDCSEGECKACNNYVDQLEDVLNHSVPQKIAGFIAEPIQGVGGSVQYPKNYLKKAYELVRERGGVCIADEVQTGFARPGSHFWGFEASGVTPDIVTMAKGIGNGYPLSAVVTTPEIAASLTKAIHFNTFGGNPVACAIGSAVLDVIDQENMMQRADELGTFLLKELAKLRDEFEIVGDVRGKGLMIGVEFVKSKSSKTPLPLPDVNKIWEDCKNMGVLIGKGGFYGNVFRIKPPMCITKADVVFTINVLRRALENYG